MALAGYSGTPLVKKLGIKPGDKVALVNEPLAFPRERDRASKRDAAVTASFPFTRSMLRLFSRRPERALQTHPRRDCYGRRKYGS